MQGHRTRARLNAGRVARCGAAIVGTVLLAASAVAQTVAPAAPAPAAAPYPARAVLDAFRAACSRLDTLADAERQVLASGWTRVADPMTTPVAGLVAFGRTAAAEMLKKSGGTMSPMAVFDREVAGERLYLVLSGVTVEDRTVNGCRAYDIDEPRRISTADAIAWTGRKPDQAIDRAELVRATWEPGLTKAQDSFELFHVPAGSPVLQLTQLAGIALKADQITTTGPAR